MPAADNKNKKPPVIAIIRVTGGFLFLGGIAFLVNLGGIGDMIFPADGNMQNIFGGILMAAGIMDFTVVPLLLSKKIGGDKAL